MLNNKYVFFCAFTLFSGIVLIGQRVFSDDEQRKVTESPNLPYKMQAAAAIPDEGLVLLDMPLVNGYTGYVVASGRLFRLRDGLNLSGKVMNHAALSCGDFPAGYAPKMQKMDFSRSSLVGAGMSYVDFVDCSFRFTRLYSVWAPGSRFINCDFTGAWISGSTELTLSREQLLSTSSFKHKEIMKFDFDGDLNGVDFSGFNLKGSRFDANFEGADFSDAIITDAYLGTRLSREQLFSTASFKNGDLRGVSLAGIDFSGTSLSKMDLSGCFFGVNTNFHATDLTDSIISRCDFSHADNMTLEQIKSTWNYKAGRMSDILLPKAIQQALDAETKE